MARKLLIPLCMLIGFSAHPQSAVDSITQVLNGKLADSSRVNALLELAEAYGGEGPGNAEEAARRALFLAQRLTDKRFEVNAMNTLGELFEGRAIGDSAVHYYQRALSTADRISYPEGRGVAQLGLANSYMRMGDLEQGERFLRQRISLAREMNDMEGAAGAYNTLGNIHNERGAYAEAMEAYTAAAKINADSGNERDAGINLANIGMIHQKLDNQEQAVSYFEQSDRIFRKYDFPLGRAFVQKSMGISYRKQGEPEKALEQYRMALRSYQQMDRKRETAQVYQNIGNIHSDQKEHAQAIDNYRHSVKIATALRDSINMAMASQSLGLEYFYMNQLDSAETYSRMAVGIAQPIGADLTVMDGFKTLSDVYYRQGRYETAYDFRLRYEGMRDSLYTLEKRDLAEEVEARYQNEQKTQEIALLAAEKEVQALQLGRRKNERNAIIGIALFILILALLLFNQNRIRQKTNRELKDLDRMKSNFFANISHEFRTPLTLIQGPIEQAGQKGGRLDPEEVEVIHRNTGKLLGLVNQLLDLSKIDAGKLELHLSEADVFDSLRVAAASFNSHASQRNIDFQVHIPDEVLWASCDLEKIERIVYNLLSNAFKFSQEHAWVRFTASHSRGSLRLEVADSGIGIPDDQLNLIFDRFYQADGNSSRNAEGTGIGLSLCKALAELMEGSIRVSSSPGKGTCFTLELPLKERSFSRSQILPTDAAPPMDHSRKGSFEFPEQDTREAPKVLIVEDNRDMSRYVEGLLSQAFHIVQASNGEQGLRAALRETPDLIITDLMMPGMDGTQLCHELKTRLETSHIPIIMLTARAGAEDKIKGLETGADDYLTKPFSQKELSIRISNLITQRQRLKQYYTENRGVVDPGQIGATSMDRQFLGRVLDLLENNYASPEFGVKEMQRELAMSKTQLNRKLKALTGESPRDILKNFRLRRAAQLLSGKADTVTQIAYGVGFGNPAYFAKCFRELYGVPPSSYA